MRLFVGIPLPAAAIRELTAITTRLQSAGDGLRWSRSESWHVTLEFLGNTSREQYECVAARLRELRSPPVPICLERLGCFDRAGVLFAGVKLAPELLRLQQRVKAATGICGFVADTRPYQPHITLARSKGKGRGLYALKARVPAAPIFTRFVADEFLLFESFLGAGGSVYEVRARFPLGPALVSGSSQ